jgi:hypothetical protein
MNTTGTDQHDQQFNPANRASRPSGGARSTLAKFETPATVFEARNRLAALFADISLIEVQLTDPNKTDGTERRLSKEEYRRWRKSARYALASKRAEQMFLKTWIQNTREKKADEMLHRFKDSREVIFGLVQVVNHLFDSCPDLTLSTADQATIDLARGMVNQVVSTAD